MMKLNIVVLCLVVIASQSAGAERVYHGEICNNFLQKSFRGSCEQCCVKRAFDRELSVCEVGISCTCGKEMEVRPEDRIYYRELERDESVCSFLRRGLSNCPDCCNSKGFNHHQEAEGRLANTCTCVRRQESSYAEIKDQQEEGQRLVSRPDLGKLFAS